MFSDPQFWVFIAFMGFIGVVFNPIRKFLASNLDNKIYEIKKSINTAEKLKSEAQQTLSDIKKRQKEVAQEIKKINQDSKNRIFVAEQNALKKLKEQIDKRNKLFNIKINQMTREANIEIHQYVAQTAINAAIVILEKKLNKDEKQNLINKSVDELNLILKH